MKKLIEADRSVIVALDVDTVTDCRNLVEAVSGVPGIGGFKVGLTLGLQGLQTVVKTIRSTYGSPTIVMYDHQKAGTDIPGMGKKFAHTVAHAGCDAAILFPLAGPKTQEEWTEACQDEGLHVIVGGIMTHEKFLVGEGGYIEDEAPMDIYGLALEQEVRDFVVPGTKVGWVHRIRAFLDNQVGPGNFVLDAPGFIDQGGDITECGRAAGQYFHAIVGSAIYKERGYDARRVAAMRVTSQIAVAA